MLELRARMPIFLFPYVGADAQPQKQYKLKQTLVSLTALVLSITSLTLS